MPTVVHKYLTKCQINPQPPGFADFIRGTLVLYQKARKYGYTVELDYSHPVLQLLKGNDGKSHPGHTIELICPVEFHQQDAILNQLFQSGQDFMTLTNILPGDYYSVPLDSDTKQFLKTLLTPNDKITGMINNIVPITPFVVVHVRTGDHYMLSENTRESDTKLYNKTKEVINSLVLPIVLISDNGILKNSLAKETNVILTNTDPVHTGSLLQSNVGLSERLGGVLIDFGVMSKAQHIYCVSLGGSGFSYICSTIYDIPLTNIIVS